MCTPKQRKKAGFTPRKHNKKLLGRFEKLIKCYFINSGDKPQKVYFDTAAEVSELAEYAAENGLCMGSSAVCIETGKTYLLNSFGQFIEQTREG